MLDLWLICQDLLSAGSSAKSAKPAAPPDQYWHQPVWFTMLSLASRLSWLRCWNDSLCRLISLADTEARHKLGLSHVLSLRPIHSVPLPISCCVNHNSGFAFSFYSHLSEVASQEVSFVAHTVRDGFSSSMRMEEQGGWRRKAREKIKRQEKGTVGNMVYSERVAGVELGLLLII